MYVHIYCSKSATNMQNAIEKLKDNEIVNLEQCNK